MSDTMLFGILRMPFDLAMSTPTSRLQYHQRGQQAADEIERLRAENERLRAEIDGLEAELALMKSGFEVAYRMLGDKP